MRPNSDAYITGDNHANKFWSRRRSACHAHRRRPVSSQAADAVAVDEPPAADDATPEVLPLIEIEESAELQADFGVGKRTRTSAIYATVEPEITVNLSGYLNVHGHFIFEPVRDPIEGRMNTFKYQGLYAEELYAGVNIGEATFHIGKINPDFGVASDEAPGLNRAGFAGGSNF